MVMMFIGLFNKKSNKNSYVLWLVLLLTGCNQNATDKIISVSGLTMGTTYNIQVVQDKNSPKEQALEKEIQIILDSLEMLMSTWRNDSEISTINQMPEGQWIKVSSDTFYVIELAQALSKQSKGAFDITLDPLIELWGFGARQTGDVIPDEKSIKQALSRTGYQNIMIDNVNTRIKKKIPLRINLSAIAKGYAVDKVAEYIEKKGNLAYMVEIGGEIRAKGKKSDGLDWRIAIEAPVAQTRIVHRIISISDKAIATSGDYRNYFEVNGQRYSHTIDPVTGKPITHDLVSVTVLSETAARADALATTLMVMGADAGFDFCEKNAISAYFIYRTGQNYAVRHSYEFQKYITIGEYRH